MTAESGIKINVCLQEKVGSCMGCPALPKIKALTEKGMSTQSAKWEVGACPDGCSPQLDKLSEKASGAMGQ